MEIATRLSGEIANYLDLGTRQIQLTARNMANIDTPGYRAVGLDFDAEMRQAIADASIEANAAAASGSGSKETVAIKPKVFPVDGLVVRPDGNNVSMDRESLNLAEAQLKFKTGVTLLRHEFTRISDAIHADAK